MNDLLILAHLLPGAQHGYALKKQVGLITGQPEMHNNLIYPRLRQFQKNGWITRRSAPGKRGQTREVYALTRAGRQELLRQLGDFSERDARSETAFRLRVGMFGVLDRETRRRILRERDQWLAARQKRVEQLTGVLVAGPWGLAVLKMLAQQIRAERKWISLLNRRV